MRDRLNWLIIIVIVINILYIPSNTMADGKVGISTEVDGTKIKYKIANNTNKTIDKFHIEELPVDKDGNALGDFVDTSGGKIKSGESVTIAGESYEALSGQVTINYTLFCKFEDSEEEQEVDSGKVKLNLAEIRLKVGYSTDPSEPVLKDTNVKYTANVKSNSDITIRNISVIDSVHGELGWIEVLEPGKSIDVSNSFRITESTKSHVILKFDDPFVDGKTIERNLTETGVTVDVLRIVPDPKIAMSVKADKTAIIDATDVTFNIDISNTGNVALTNIRLTDWNSKAVDIKERLEPGGNYTVEFTKKVEPGKTYKISCIASAEGTDKGVGTFYEVTLKDAKSAVEIDRRVSPETYEMGDSITIEYIVRNSGGAALKDIKLEEPNWQGREIGKIDYLESGEERILSIRLDLTAPIKSEVILTGINTITGEEYRYEAATLSIGSDIREEEMKLDITLKSDPEMLEKPGSIILEAVIKNIGNGTLKNAEVLLKDSDIVLGSFIELLPGSEKTITSTAIDIDETSTFRVVIKGTNSAGNKVEFTSSPLTIEVGKNVESETIEEDPKQSGKIAILKTVMVVLVLLIILVAGTLVYLLWGPGKDKKKAKGIKNLQNIDEVSFIERNNELKANIDKERES